MKKFTSLFFAACAFVAGASAQELVPETIEIPDGNFEQGTAKGDPLSDVWQQANASATFSYANYNKAHSEDPELVEKEGNWYTRCVFTSGELPAGTYIYQEIDRPGPGVYALSAEMVVSRNSCKGGLNDAQFGFLFLGDTDSDIDDMEDPGFLVVPQTNKMEADAEGNLVPVQDYSRKFVRVIMESNARRGGLTVAAGVPVVSEPISKGWVEVENMKLEYFGQNVTVQDVKDYYEQTSAVEGIEAAPIQNDKIYNLQGIEVKDASAPGIYIKNGKKFVVR